MRAFHLKHILEDGLKHERPSTPVLVYSPSRDEYFDISSVSFLNGVIVNIAGEEVKQAVILTIDE